METLEQQWAVFIETHREIVEKTDRKHNYFTSEAYELTEENINYKSELKEALRQFSSAKVIQDKQSTTGKCTTVKLPKIVIPIFSGKYTEWITFRDLFLSLIHNNDSIDDVQKLHYLKGYLAGEPEQLLRQPITAANDQKCWQTLTKRYDNRRYLSN